MKTYRRVLLSRWLRRIPSGGRHARLYGAVLAAILALVAVIAVSRAFSVSCSDDADCVTLSELKDGAPLPEALRLYDREGDLLAEVAGPLRRTLPADRIPELLADAFITVEDRRFWEHEGVDVRGVVRAAFRNLRGGGISEGASTIPMQLVRTLWSESLRDAGAWRRKAIEARTAPRLIDELGHERVLTLYLNSIYLGDGVYGVERAAQHYFGVGADELSVGEIATLVGMTRSPEFYDPRVHPERARLVRGIVLSQLVDERMIDAEQAERAAEEELDVVPLDSLKLSTRSHLTASVTRELRRVAPELAGQPGLEIHTTIDRRIQREAEESLALQLAEIESGRYGEFEEAADSSVRLEGAAVALDSRSAEILAWVGGRDFSRSEFDRVDQARRQVGSLVKPFLVALAIERGYGILDMVSADTVSIRTAEGYWSPADHVTDSLLPLREALVRSSNRAAAHLGVSLGLDQLASVGARVGLSRPIPALPSTAIGAFDAALLEMTSAYSIFGNGGLRAEPYLLTRIEHADGRVLWERPDTATPERVMDQGTAFVVLDAMRAVVDRGTGSTIRGWGYRGPAAGKTGTTNDGRDAWFVGLTPEIVAGVWVGFDAPRPIVEDRGGSVLAAPVWATWMRSLQGEIPMRRAWVPPLAVERVRYDATTGETIGPHCRIELGAVYQEAWVTAGRYDRLRCPPTGLRGWFDRLWRSVNPGDSGDPGATPPRPPGGG